jgi:hypothetical protein
MSKSRCDSASFKAELEFIEDDDARPLLERSGDLDKLFRRGRAAPPASGERGTFNSRARADGLAHGPAVSQTSDSSIRD